MACLLGAMGLADRAYADDLTGHLLSDRQDLDISYNKHVANLRSVLEGSDKLSLLYIVHSDKKMDANGQDWTMLDRMFLKVLDELKGGYVDTYVVDCATEHPQFDPDLNLQQIC